MDWLSFEDEMVHDMEQLVLKYNPNWTGYGFKKYEYAFPEWAKDNFEIDTIKSYNETLEFTKDDWIGRILSCRGVGACLAVVAKFLFANAKIVLQTEPCNDIIKVIQNQLT